MQPDTIDTLSTANQMVAEKGPDTNQILMMVSAFILVVEI